MDTMKIVFNTPWKLINELLMYFIKPVVYLYLKINGVDIDRGFKFYGFPKIYRHRKSRIIIGKNFECRSWWFSNPLGINHPTILCTWSDVGEILIGDDVGISGGSVVASNKVSIGDGTIIGANSTVIDTDFHPLGTGRRYSTRGIRSKPVIIGKNVFVGMNSIILKGVIIPDNAIVPAGSVIRRWEK